MRIAKGTQLQYIGFGGPGTEMTEPKQYEMNGAVRLGRRRPTAARTVSSKDVVGEE
jgi:hypothetical protein